MPLVPKKIFRRKLFWTTSPPPPHEDKVFQTAVVVKPATGMCVWKSGMFNHMYFCRVRPDEAP